MDFESIENGCSISSTNVAFTSENRFCQDTQLRCRKSPRKRLRVTRTSALVIDQLRSSFQRAGDFAPRVRTRRNWRPEFLIRYLSDNRRGDNEGCAALQRGESCCRSFVPETPRIYSIGLHSCVKSISGSDDLLNAFSAIGNFRKHLRRSIIICKHWVAQSTASLSTAVSFEEPSNQQTRVIDCLETAEVFKVDRFQNNRHDDQPYERVEEKVNSDVPSTLPNNHVFGDCSFTLNFDHSFMRKCCKHSRPLVTKKDAQVQTSSKNISRRQQTVKKSKSTNDRILRHEQNELTFRSSIADFRFDFHSLDKINRNEKSRLFIRFLENKRAEYINKFTAVKRQIEEITATLRETCRSEKSSRGNSENCERYFSSTHDSANANSKEDVNSDEVEEDNDIVFTEDKDVSEEEDDIIRGSVDDHKNVERILDVTNVNHEVFSSKNYSKNVSTTNLSKNPNGNDIFTCDCMLTMKEMLCPSTETPRNSHKKRTKCRFGKQISFQNQNLMKNDDETREFPAEDRSSHEVYLRNNFMAENNNENTEEVLVFRKMIVDEKLSEIAILNDIKKRIDRDFENPSSKSENYTGDFFTVSQRNINFENDSQLYRSATTADTMSTTIVELSPSLNSTETQQIRDSAWTDTISELSNKNSTFSMYHSCTQFPSFISLRENEDELAFEAEDRSVIDDGSYLNLHSNDDLNVHSNVDYSQISSNDNSQSNFNFHRSRDDVRGVAQNTSTSEYTSRNKFLSEVIDESNNARDVFGSQEMADKGCDCEYPFSESNEKEKESCVHSEQQYTADTTFETSKSSRYIGSIDSGVFVNSSLIDLQPHENSFDGGESDHKKKQRRVQEREFRGSSRTFDFSSDSSNSSSNSCRTDDTLDRRINDVIRDLTKNLVLCERRVRMKLREMRKTGLRARETRYSLHSPPRAYKFNNILYDDFYDFFKSPRRSCEDERISGVSTPSFMSLPESEIEDH